MARTILVVDDDEDVLRILRFSLERAGYAVQTASDGQQARDQIDRQRPDLIVLDLKMPRLNGYQLFAQLKSDEKTRSIPVLVVTALTQGSDLSDEDWARRMGAEGFLTKPFDLDALGQRVNELVAAMG